MASPFQTSVVVLSALSIFTWSGSAAAQPEPAPVAPEAGPSEVAPAEAVPPGGVPTLPSAVTSPAPSREATNVQGSISPPPEPAGEAPPVTEIGIERLPGSAYPEPQTRGLKYGSLWLTFHGLQWPYVPARPGRDRFVLGVSGWGWLDAAFAKYRPWGNNDQAVGTDQLTNWVQQGRMLLRLTPTYSVDDWFVQGQVELVGTLNQLANRSDIGGADTDDLWLRVGQWNKWDFQIGRFEGWEVFHLGMGLDQNTYERQGAIASGGGDPGIVTYYGLTDNQFRPVGAAGNLAVHIYPLRYLRFEGLVTLGNSGGAEIATRPVAILDFGWLKLKGGFEYSRTQDENRTVPDVTTKKGVGGAIQFVFDPHIELGLNLAQGTVFAIDINGKENLAGSYTRTSYGGFANVSNGSARHPILWGVGGLFTRDVDQASNPNNPGVTDNYTMWQSFVAVQYVALSQLYIKLVGSYAHGHFSQAGTTIVTWDDEVYSIRLRLAMYF